MVHLIVRQRFSSSNESTTLKSKADRHKSRAPSNQRSTDGPTEQRTNRPTKWLLESHARNIKWLTGLNQGRPRSMMMLGVFQLSKYYQYYEYLMSPKETLKTANII